MQYNYFFFFQAEDGIRDIGVTGVQTCALPILATGGYGNVFYLSTNAKGSNATAIWRAHKRGAYMANPCYTQIHPTRIPVKGDYQSKLTLMSESLSNDGREIGRASWRERV